MLRNLQIISLNLRRNSKEKHKNAIVMKSYIEKYWLRRNKHKKNFKKRLHYCKKKVTPQQEEICSNKER